MNGFEYYYVFDGRYYIPSSCFDMRFLMIPMWRETDNAYKIFVYDLSRSMHDSLLVRFNIPLTNDPIVKLEPYQIGGKNRMMIQCWSGLYLASLNLLNTLVVTNKTILDQ